MLDELDIDEVWPEDRQFGGTPNAEYWRKNYARLEGLLRRFQDLALTDESISLSEVGQLQRALETATECVDERERQERKRLQIAKARRLCGRAMRIVGATQGRSGQVPGPAFPERTAGSPT